MARWLYTIDISNILNNEKYTTDEYPMQEAEDELNPEFKKAFIEEISKCSLLLKFIPLIELCETVDEFNYELNCIFDYADLHRIWINTIPGIK